jgi:hypothetical protein
VSVAHETFTIATAEEAFRARRLRPEPAAPAVEQLPTSSQQEHPNDARERMQRATPLLLAQLASLGAPADIRTGMIRLALSVLTDGTAADLADMLVKLGSDYAVMADFGDPGQGEAQDALLGVARQAATLAVTAQRRALNASPPPFCHICAKPLSAPHDCAPIVKAGAR